MKKIKLHFIILTVTLLLISVVFVLLLGNKITLKLDLSKYNTEDSNLTIFVDQDKEIIDVIDTRKTKDYYWITIKGVQKGNAFIEVVDGKNNYYYYNKIYVHPSKIITIDSFFGKTRGDILIPISILIITVYGIYILINKYKSSMNESIYQYRNVTYLSTIVFLIFFLINQLFVIVDYNGLIHTIDNIENTISGFTIVVLPIAFITFIFVTITNIILMKKEGFTWKNMLGTILGIVICFLTITPELLNRLSYTTNIMNLIDVHNEKGLGLYLFDFTVSSICVLVSYLECILIGTIIIGIKAGEKVPSFDKDYIIILGCMIRKNGKLTKLLQGRVDRAIEFGKMQKEKTGKDIIFIPSGGQGKNEVMSEALAMKNYLIDKGIKSKNIILEDKSTSTLENIKNSYKLVKNKKAKFAFSTTNYHVFRAGIIANELNYDIEGIGSRTKTYFGINAFIREFVATLNSERKKHIKMIIALLSIILFIVVIDYFGAVL